MMIQQPRVRTKTYGDKRFDKTASTFWNNLPSENRNEQSLEIFKKNVKTYLFRIAYLWFYLIFLRWQFYMFFKNF